MLVIQVKKKNTDYDAKIKDTKNKYFTTSDYNKFINNIFNEKIKAKFLVNESDLTEKIKTLETKEEIKKVATQAKSKVLSIEKLLNILVMVLLQLPFRIFIT